MGCIELGLLAGTRARSHSTAIGGAVAAVLVLQLLIPAVPFLSLSGDLAPWPWLYLQQVAGFSPERLMHLLLIYNLVSTGAWLLYHLLLIAVPRWLVARSLEQAAQA